MSQSVTATSRTGASTVRHKPIVSVLVVTSGGNHLQQCLASLAEQTLPAEDYEVVVVSAGGGQAVTTVVVRARELHSRLRLRMLQLVRGDTEQGRNVGLQAARGAFVTYLDDDGALTPGCLGALLENAGPDDVPVLARGIVPATSRRGGAPTAGAAVQVGSFPAPGRLDDAESIATATTLGTCQLVPTERARRTPFDESLPWGAPLVHRLTLQASHDFRLTLLPVEAGLDCRIRSDERAERDDYESVVTPHLRLLSALETAPAGRAVDDVVAVMRLDHGRAVNRYLRDHPTRHARVAEDVRRLRLRRFPWHEVNKGLANDVALLYCFPPYLDTSGLVAARRLRERGVVTDVVSNAIPRLRALDPGSVNVAAEVVGRHAVLGALQSFGHWDAVTDFARKAVEQVEAWERDTGPYTRVYSRSMAVASHFAAALLKLKRPEIEWVAEFSDPLKVHPDASERSSPMSENWLATRLRGELRRRGHELPPTLLFEFAELLVYALADRLVFTNDEQQRLMLGYCRVPELAARADLLGEVSHHPTLPPDFYRWASWNDPLDADVTHIGYFGVFYLTRGLEEVLAAVDSLPYAVRRRLCLHVFTSRPGPLRLEVTRAGLSDVIVVRPFLPFLEFLAATRAFDVLLVKDARAQEHFGLNPYLPSKVSDYRGSGTDIWAITEPGSPLDAQSTTYTSSVGDVDGATRVLRQLAARARGEQREMVDATVTRRV